MNVCSDKTGPANCEAERVRPKLLDQVRDIIRVKHYSIRTEKAYIDWIKRYILFNGKKHPAEMDESHISSFLTYLAVQQKVASSTQNQALCAIVFLYRFMWRAT